MRRKGRSRQPNTALPWPYKTPPLVRTKQLVIERMKKQFVLRKSEAGP